MIGDQAQIEKDGMRWLLGAGLVAVIFAVWLSCVDYKLTNSDVEEVRYETMRAVRTAQTTLPSQVSDERLIQTANVRTQNDFQGDDSNHGEQAHH